eukprot:scpid97370/ scgid22544/ 
MHAHHDILLASYCGAFRSSELVVVWNTAREQHYIGAASKCLILAMSLLPLPPPEPFPIYSSLYDAAARFPVWERSFQQESNITMPFSISDHLLVQYSTGIINGGIINEVMDTGWLKS